MLYAGLLDEVHRKFLAFTLSTQQDRNAPEDQPRVLASFEGQYLDSNGVLRGIRTSGIGTAGRGTDRSGPAKDAPIEMAETRAKARALRDAVNVGATSLEELPSEDEQPQPRSKPPTDIELEQEYRGKVGLAPKQDTVISPQTLKHLRFLADTFAEARDESLEWHWQKFEENLGGAAADMTEEEGQKWIGRYKKGLAKLEESHEERSAAE